jgi:CRISPR-associated protein Cmr2
MNYLIGITIGPVQSFIEESKKLKDLKNSSTIISDIMRDIFNYIISKNKNAELIYPRSNNFSNSMIIKTDILIDLKDLKNNLYDNYLESLKNIFHIFYAIKEIKNDDYLTSYKSLTTLIRNLKNTYEFENLNFISDKKNCILCGKRPFIKDNNGDELCEICNFKREYKRYYTDHNFPSVYSVSIKNWINMYKNELSTLQKIIDNTFNPLDKSLYYNQSTIENYISLLKKSKTEKFENEIKSSPNELYKVKEEMDKIFIANKIPKPNFEYAFIQMDIDNLGNWMSGNYIGKFRQKNLLDFQKNLSDCLKEFSDELKSKLLKNKLCEIIYSGGDDFLAIAPTENVICISKIMKDTFKTIVKNNIKSYHEITYSLSITIAQCKDPMSYALKKTRSELKNVKNYFTDKNGIALSYIINNGKEIIGYLKRDSISKYWDLTKNLCSIKDLISYSFINNFEFEFKNFDYEQLSYDETNNLKELQKTELKRLFKRSCKKTENSGNFDLISNEIISFFDKIFTENTLKISPNIYKINFENIMNIFRLLQKFSKEYETFEKYKEVILHEF